MSVAPFEAVTFDVGGTLIEPWPPVGHVYADVAAEFGEELSPDELNAGFARAWQARGNFDYSQAAWRTLVREVFGARWERLPPEFFPRVYHRFTTAEAWRIFDDVLPAFEELARHGIRLAVISNWDERLHPMLEGLGLTKHFEVVISSHQAGAVKPQREIFAVAADRLGLAPARILHVGDSHWEDFLGAQEAGMSARLIDRKQPSCAVARRMRSLAEVMTLVSAG